MGKKIIFTMVLVLITAILQTGCSQAGKDAGDEPKVATEEKNPAAVQEEQSGKLMEEFNTLAGKDARAADIINFLNKNVSAVSRESASKMVMRLEEVQKTERDKIEDKLINIPSFSEKMMKIYTPDFDLNKIDGIEDSQLKSALSEARAGGFKIETAEGMFFPIIDYGLYRKYSSSVTADIKDYIDIMAVESGKVSAKDAGLVIGWDEVIKRAFMQEKFIAAYKSSPRYSEVKRLYGNYVDFILFGANNTPLFSYDSKTMDPEAKEAYRAAVKSIGSTEIGKTIEDYLGVLEKSGYKLTGEVDKYRKNAAEKLKE